MLEPVPHRLQSSLYAPFVLLILASMLLSGVNARGTIAFAGSDPVLSMGSLLGEIPEKVNAAGMPLAFIPNRGQSDDWIAFQTGGLNGALFFAADRVVISLLEKDIQIQFEGANPRAELSGQALLPGIVNYFAGSSPTQWFIQVPTYAQIVYNQLYAGTDLLYEGVQGRLKGTYIVAPGSDPNQIRWRYRGAASVWVDEANGDLQIALSTAPRTGASRLVERRPVAWQVSGSRRIPVDVRYQVSKNGAISFVLGEYDKTRVLFIDPDLVYSSYLAGTQPDDGYTIAVDGQGNAYVAGSTRSTDFLGQDGSSGTEDVWIAKLDAAGKTPLYTTFLVGGDDERPDDIVVDDNGNAYITGYTTSDDFPTRYPAQAEIAGGFDFFVTKLNSTGGLAYSTYLGTQYTEQPAGIAIDSQGQAHITGMILAKAVIYKLDSGGQMLYGALFGTDSYGETSGRGIAVNQAGEVFLSGTTGDKDLDITPGALQTICDGVVDEYRSCRGDLFLLKLNNANVLDDLQILYSSYYGGKGADIAEDLVIGGDGYLYVTGNTISVDFPTTGSAYTPACPSGVDPENEEQCLNIEAFVAKFEPDFGGVVYSTYFGGDYKDYGLAIAPDSGGAAYVAGWTEGNDLPLVDEIQPHAGGVCYTYSNLPRLCIDGFVTKLSSTGSLVYNTYLGGISDDFIFDLAVRGNGDAFVVGNTLSHDFPTTAGSVQAEAPNLGRHGFVSKIGTGGGPPPDPDPDPDPPPDLGFNLYLPFVKKP